MKLFSHQQKKVAAKDCQSGKQKSLMAKNSSYIESVVTTEMMYHQNHMLILNRSQCNIPQKKNLQRK